MEVYIEPLVTADIILGHIVNNGGQSLFYGMEPIEEMEYFNTGILRLITDGYILNVGSPGIEKYRITKEGIEFIEKGGYRTKYILGKLEQEKNDIKEQEEDELRRYNIKNAKRIFKTYWWTFCFSVIALIISLILLGLKLAEVAK